jgi:hypothetical protein
MLQPDQLHPDSHEARRRTVAAIALTFADHTGSTDPAMELYHLAEGDPQALAGARQGLLERPGLGLAPATVGRAIVDLGTAELWALVAPRPRAALAR